MRYVRLVNTFRPALVVLGMTATLSLGLMASVGGPAAAQVRAGGPIVSAPLPIDGPGSEEWN